MSEEEESRLKDNQRDYKVVLDKILHDAGNVYSHGLQGVRDLVIQRDGRLFRIQEAEADLSDMTRRLADSQRFSVDERARVTSLVNECHELERQQVIDADKLAFSESERNKADADVVTLRDHVRRLEEGNDDQVTFLTNRLTALEEGRGIRIYAQEIRSLKTKIASLEDEKHEMIQHEHRWHGRIQSLETEKSELLRQRENNSKRIRELIASIDAMGHHLEAAEEQAREASQAYLAQCDKVASMQEALDIPAESVSKRFKAMREQNSELTGANISLSSQASVLQQKILDLTNPHGRDIPLVESLKERIHDLEDAMSLKRQKIRGLQEYSTKSDALVHTLEHEKVEMVRQVHANAARIHFLEGANDRLGTTADKAEVKARKALKQVQQQNIDLVEMNQRLTSSQQWGAQQSVLVRQHKDQIQGLQHDLTAVMQQRDRLSRTVKPLKTDDESSMMKSLRVANEHLQDAVNRLENAAQTPHSERVTHVDYITDEQLRELVQERFDLRYKVDQKAELGGAVGRIASIQCRTGMHSQCLDQHCMCRHHGRALGDVPSNLESPADADLLRRLRFANRARGKQGEMIHGLRLEVESLRVKLKAQGSATLGVPYVPAFKVVAQEGGGVAWVNEHQITFNTDPPTEQQRLEKMAAEGSVIAQDALDHGQHPIETGLRPLPDLGTTSYWLEYIGHGLQQIHDVIEKSNKIREEEMT